MIIFLIISFIINFLAIFKNEKYTKLFGCTIAAVISSVIIFPVFFNFFNLIKS
jgi:hypothetical protein